MRSHNTRQIGFTFNSRSSQTSHFPDIYITRFDSVLSFNLQPPNRSPLLSVSWDFSDVKKTFFFFKKKRARKKMGK